MPLDPKVRQALERRGVDSVRALLVSMANGFAGTGRGAAVDLGDGVYASRGDMEDWLSERKRADTLWVKTGTIAAIVAAVLAFFAWALPIDTLLAFVGRIFSVK